jgi:hypothetical protein
VAGQLVPVLTEQVERDVTGAWHVAGLEFGRGADVADSGCVRVDTGAEGGDVDSASCLHGGHDVSSSVKRPKIPIAQFRRRPASGVDS